MRATSGLRLVTANCASGRGVDGRHDLTAWAAAAAALDADVLAVQEVDHLLARSGGLDQSAQVARACAGDGPRWSARFAAAVHGTPGSPSGVRPARAGDPAEPSYGVALLTRHPVRAWHELRLAPSRASLPLPGPGGPGRRVQWVPDEPRVAVAAVVAAPGLDVTAVCTHLSFAPQRAVGQLREVAAWARRLPGPVLLLGDLNLPGRLPSLLTGWTPLARATTFPASRPRLQLDHVLAAPGAPLPGVAAAGPRALAGSDHLALVVDLHPATGRS